MCEVEEHRVQKCLWVSTAVWSPEATTHPQPELLPLAFIVLCTYPSCCTLVPKPQETALGHVVYINLETKVITSLNCRDYDQEREMESSASA